jgi:RNA polymerase sigma-70 factor, ECF subfamily
MSSSVGSRNSRFVGEVWPHAAAAYNLARWLSRSDADARDIVQEAFVRALRYFEGFRGDSARAWLLSIVRNTAYTWRRSNPPPAAPETADASLPAVGPDDVEQDTDTDPLNAIMSQERADGLRKAIAQLPVEYREVLILRELEDLSYRQIATIVGCPIGTVMSRLSRARDELSSRLRPEEPST